MRQSSLVRTKRCNPNFHSLGLIGEKCEKFAVRRYFFEACDGFQLGFRGRQLRRRIEAKRRRLCNPQ